jgi:hypothetical protein
LAFIELTGRSAYGSRGRSDYYRGLLDRSRLIREFIDGMSLVHLRTRDAACRVDGEPVTDHMLKVGDRALAMDPISSQGIAAAVRSGLQASRVIHTILSCADADAAVEFYRNSVRSSAKRHIRHRTEVYASQGFHASRFWAARSAPHSAAGSRSLRASINVWYNPTLSVSPLTSIVTVPVLEGDVIRRRAALAHPSLDQPVAWLGGLALAPVIAAIDKPQSSTRILELISRQSSEGRARQVFDWLTAQGILVRS